MRSNDDFIELTSNNKKILFNKKAIIFITPNEKANNAVVVVNDGDRQMRYIVKEDYSDVASELLWGYDPRNVCINDYEIDLNVDGGAE